MSTRALRKSVVILIVISMFPRLQQLVRAEEIKGVSGSQSQYGSGWLDLDTITDFKKGERIRLVIGGSAKQVLVRFLPRDGKPETSIGLEGGIRLVPPTDRTLEIVLEADHKGTKQVSVHGGPEAWSISLGKNNGPATLAKVERR